MKYAIKPTVPQNCLKVLIVTDGIIHGWMLPAYFPEKTNQWKEGTTFVFLTQENIDTHIPPHSEEVDEEHQQYREQTQPNPDSL